MPEQLTILVADDHPLFRGAMRQALVTVDGQPDIIEAGDFEEARQKARSHPDADLILLDLAMPGVSGLSGLMAFRSEFSSLPVVVVSASEDPATIRRVLDLGASGFIPKSTRIDEIRTAVRRVLDGEIWIPENIDLKSSQKSDIDRVISRIQTLTPQQGRVLNMLAEGLLNKQIAYELSVSEATIKAHVSAILQKLNVDSRTQAVILLSRISAETPASV